MNEPTSAVDDLGRGVDATSRHAVIVGCGRVGAGLATELADRAWTVTVIDTDPSAFRRIRHAAVECHVGMGYDRSTLVGAGVEHAAAVGAVTNGDNTNIVVARTALERFRVPRVFARIYDSRRAAIYERLGVPTIASASITIDRALRTVCAPDELQREWTDATARVCLVERHATAAIVGHRYHDLERPGVVRVAAVQRLGAALIPTADLVVQEGDVVHLMVRVENVDEVDHLIGAASEDGHR